MHIELSIIIPVIDESSVINQTLSRLELSPPVDNFEIIVVDGDPQGNTIKSINPHVGPKKIIVKTVISNKSGRGVQMNTGAGLSTGNTLLFLHADTVLSRQAVRSIPLVIQDRSLVCGAFSLGIHSCKRSYRLIETMANLRSRATRLPYGDQTQFFKKNYFHKIGGFSDIPLMEDVEIMQRVKKRKDRCRILPAKVYTSARRWEKEGALFVTLRNWTLISLYTLGVSPQRLAKYYHNLA